MLLLSGTVVLVAVFCNQAFPVISGYAAKSMCSEIFLAGRTASDISKTDLAFFPVSLAKCIVSTTDSSVTAEVFGHWQQKAIFRAGIGSTLVHNLQEGVMRKQGIGYYHRVPLNTDSVDWPMGERAILTGGLAVNSRWLEASVNDFFKEDDSSSLKNTRALLVVYKGQVIAERYAEAFNKNSMFLGWSMGKSIGGALIGILQQERKLDYKDPLSLKAWQQVAGDPRLSIRIRDVLQQASGLDFEENYAKSSDVTAMLYKKTDMANFTASRPLLHKPGVFFNYSSGNANLLSLKMRELLGDAGYHAFPYEALLYRIGMRHTLIEMDGSGTFIMSSYTYATARDWARFGMLYLNKGNFNGEQVLDSSWVNASLKPASTSNFNHYGYQLWLNSGNDADNNDADNNYRAFPHAPADMFYLSGFQGQHVFIIPTKQLVVVRLGVSEKKDYRADASLSLLMKAVE